MTEEIALKPCPFCQEPVQFRKALHISDGNVDSVIHAAPSSCPMVCFEDGSVDESILDKWNTRAPAQGEPAAALRDYAQKFSRIESIWEDVRIRHNMHKDYPELARAIELLLMKP